jgi:hypothetical protein
MPGRPWLTNSDRWFFLQMYRWFLSILRVVRLSSLKRWCVGIGPVFDVIGVGSHWDEHREPVLGAPRTHVSGITWVAILNVDVGASATGCILARRIDDVCLVYGPDIKNAKRLKDSRVRRVLDGALRDSVTGVAVSSFEQSRHYAVA